MREPICAHPLDLEPGNYGHSIGWWEGDTLVIDTVAYNQDFWLDRRAIGTTACRQPIQRARNLGSLVARCCFKHNASSTRISYEGNGIVSTELPAQHLERGFQKTRFIFAVHRT